MAITLDRRSFFQAAAAAGIATQAAGQPPPAAKEGFVSSEVGRLKRVLVHEPGAEVTKAFPLFLGNHSMLTWDLLRADSVKQHQAFVGKMRDAGVEVLYFEQLLQEALREARTARKLGAWLAVDVPAVSE